MFTSQELFESIKNNDEATFQQCIIEGIDVNARGEYGGTPLMEAVSWGRMDFVKKLVSQGADLMACCDEGFDALWVANEHNDHHPLPNEMVKYLIKQIAIRQKYIDEEANDSTEFLIHKLITTLLYKANRHEWNSDVCNNIRFYLEYLTQQFKNKDQAEYVRYIEYKEKINGTFYGSYLSDNSDSGEEAAFSVLEEEEKISHYHFATKYKYWAQVKELTYRNGNLKEIESGSKTFDLNRRTWVHYSNNVDLQKITTDLALLNQLLKAGSTIEQALTELTQHDPSFTTFFVAQYRGITYQTTKWNQPSRIEHRYENEIGKRQCSTSLANTLGINFFRNYREAKEKMEQNEAFIESQAELLRELLLTLREPKPYGYKGYTYSNLAYLLQKIYTENYDYFHTLIKTHEVLKHLLINEANPFFSMGDTPYHAEKYAHGIKPYKGHESFRLRPRWRANGQAERPYSGVVYASLHPLTDFNKEGPLHVISLNWDAEILICNTIISERESCFGSYLPKDRVFFKQRAKYPSFKGPYKEIYHHKYGLDRYLYQKLQQKLVQSAPHSMERKAFKKLLGEWLCSYHEVQLIDRARAEAEAREGVLIYRDIGGLFSLSPPIDSVNRSTSSITEAMKTSVKEKKRLRTSLSPGLDSIIPLTNKANIECILDKLNQLTFTDKEEANILTEGNHLLSMPFSLFLNAVREKRYLAADYFCKKEIFYSTINDTFNTYRFEKINLLHLAILQKDEKMVKILLQAPGINLNALATETLNVDHYEGLTPLHRSNCAMNLAIFKKHYGIVGLLLNAGVKIENYPLKILLSSINYAFRYFVHKSSDLENSKNIPDEIFTLLCILKTQKMSVLTPEEDCDYIPKQGFFGIHSMGMIKTIAAKVFADFDDDLLTTAPSVCKSWNKLIEEKNALEDFESVGLVKR